MISVVIPIFNEEENLPELRRRLVGAMESSGETFEVIFVNDGSRDRSLEMLRKFNGEDSRLKVVNLSRNFGHQPAVTAGVHHARGDAVVLIDGDLQDPPEVIPAMIARWRAGDAVVLGERTGRSEAGVRSLGFRMFYPVLRALADLPSAPDAGIFGLMDRRVVEHFNRLPERNRFIPGLRSWLGFKQGAVLYDRQERAAGKPKQTLRKLIHYAMDAIFSFSYQPLRWVTWVGLFVSTVTFGLALFYLVTFFTEHKQPGSGFTTIILCVLFLGGVQMISIGILGEYIGRIYEEIKQRPLYVVEETVGIGEGEPQMNVDKHR